ncbi:MAG TPA: FkbM family methyltransferase, partial [Cellulomonadaceae bacterium]|nr:FkbM family methyltransferase [Cellulomonadaceae bacterium]
MNTSEPFVSYAQNGEDVILWRTLGNRGSCVYVDVGAFHPTYDSVTRALYERGWRGVNIEPQPDRLAAFEAERPEDVNLSLAIGDEDGTALLSLSD